MCKCLFELVLRANVIITPKNGIDNVNGPLGLLYRSWVSESIKVASVGKLADHQTHVAIRRQQTDQHGVPVWSRVWGPGPQSAGHRYGVQNSALFFRESHQQRGSRVGRLRTQWCPRLQQVVHLLGFCSRSAGLWWKICKISLKLTETSAQSVFIILQCAKCAEL